MVIHLREIVLKRIDLPLTARKVERSFALGRQPSISPREVDCHEKDTGVHVHPGRLCGESGAFFWYASPRGLPVEPDSAVPDKRYVGRTRDGQSNYEDGRVSLRRGQPGPSL